MAQTAHPAVEPAVAKVPAAQATQMRPLVTPQAVLTVVGHVPATTDVWPAGQVGEEEAPAMGLTEPLGVSLQVAAEVAPTVGEKVPAAHCVQMAAPATAQVPAGQVVQTELPAAA